MCDTFLTFPPRYQMDSYGDYITDITMKLSEQLLNIKTTEGIANIMNVILTTLYGSVKLKYVPRNYDIAQLNPVWIFHNFTNIFFMVYTWT